MSLAKLLDELEILPEPQRRAVFPIVIASFAAHVPQLPAPLQQSVDELIAELAWTEATGDAEKAASLARYFAAHGVDDAVWRRLLAALPDDPDALRDVARRLTGEPAITGALERKAPPPPGAVAAGPLARFIVQQSKKP